MGYSININWSDEWKYRFEEWNNLCQEQANNNCTHFDDNHDNNNLSYWGYCDGCGISEDSLTPMMNYYYPLRTKPTEEQIKEVLSRTNLTIMYQNEEDYYCLVLTGGGMDLSQDIALSYILCNENIPEELLRNVCTQKGLSVSGDDWVLLRKEIIRQTKNVSGWYNQINKEWTERTTD